ncbi:hypothetical protein VTL71DRAFT_9756 [Oculimacula yallundae]|uniref:C2H2-type domain-containing protein n=1 Tax=Oculimacula yallundae TaxID=86028 RepID=A0ABR4BTD3_9HELO
MATNVDVEPKEIGCQTCGEHFESREAQREHMREDWHVSNLKRKMASLPPLSLLEYEEQLPKTDIKKEKSRVQFESALHANEDRTSHSDSDAGSRSGEDFDSTECLFCVNSSDSTSENLSHMSLSHNFSIPDIEHLLDIESFLGYLSTIISTFHECLFCGSVEDSKEAVQEHMGEMGHCRLELEEDGLELKDFWDVEEGSEEETEEEETDDSAVLVDGELRLPSGKILGRRTKVKKPRMTTSLSKSRSRSSSPPQPSLNAQTQQTASSSSPTTLSTHHTAPPHSQPRPRNEHRIVPRPGTSTSLIGLSDVQQRALRATEMRIEKVETKAKKMYEAKVDRKGNKQKTFRVLSIGKKAGGLEKRNG